MEGRMQSASEGSVRGVLRCLGVELRNPGDVERAIRSRKEETWSRPLEPVIPVWAGERQTLTVRLPAEFQGEARLKLTLEDGTDRVVQVDSGVEPSSRLQGGAIDVREVPLPGRVPQGYHRLVLDIDGVQTESTLVVAPVKTYIPRGRPTQRVWGGFLPLYALGSERSWGAGDFTDLERLGSWIGSVGGALVGTLPLLSSFLGEEVFDPSPYAPASRLFWNEFYVDITRVPDLDRCSEARALVGSEGTRRELEELRQSDLVDYRRIMALKRRVLGEMARFFHSAASPAAHRFRTFLREHPEVETYAEFRAKTEFHGRPWRAWPPSRDQMPQSEHKEESRRYHLFAQWMAFEQLRSLVKGFHDQGPALYLDLPLGVHPDGYDVWRWQHLFALDASVGAPPDFFFTKGQDWGFPPMHPERLREDGYRYFISVLRNHMEHADYLRIDHVMGLHRLWWIPGGMGARDGVYVRYNAEEFYAILALESHRNRCAVVGENLGTVPGYVNRAMETHGLMGNFVAQYEAVPGEEDNGVPASVVAALNTHDMPLFAAFWKGEDIDLRVKLGFLEAAEAKREYSSRGKWRRAQVKFLTQKGLLQKGRGRQVRAVVLALLRYLASSPATLLLVNLEDLWLERRPQNVPGTSNPSNWRRKARLSLEEIEESAPIADILKELTKLRGG